MVRVYLSLLLLGACRSPSEQNAAPYAGPLCPSPAACFDRGASLVDQDPKTAAEMFTIACEGSVVAACNNLGQLHEEGRGVARDVKKALSLYERACEGSSPHGCNSL